MNINAPGAVIGNLYGTNYNMITANRLTKDVTINLVSAGTIQGINTACPGNDITNTVYNTTINKAVMHVGPQDQPSSWNPGSIQNGGDGEWYLDEKEPGLADDGYPRRINVTTNGIRNFTDMDITDRLLIAQGTGSVLNGQNATTTNHSTSYHQTGHVVINDESGLGVSGTGGFIVGDLTVNGKGYVASQGSANQIMITDINLDPNNEINHLVWLKYGTVLASAMTPATSWFGINSAWPVLTFNPQRTNAEKVSPTNLTGVEVSSGKTYIGDNSIPASGNGFGVAIPGTAYRWEVVNGPDGKSLGKISYYMAGEFLMGTQKPTSGYLDVYGTSPMKTPTQSGSVAIPSAKIPNPVGNPEFTFTPDLARGEWVYDLNVQRTDHFIVNGANSYHEGEQTIADYNNSAKVTRVWKANTSNPNGSSRPANDSEYGFDMKVDYTSVTELQAESVILKESQAQALFADTIDKAVRIENASTATKAKGRPHFDKGNLSDAQLSQLAAPLGDDLYRIVSVTYTAGNEDEKLTKAVKITIISDDAVVAGPYVLDAKNAAITISKAQAVTGKTGNGNIDYYTKAFILDTRDGTVSNIPDLADVATKVSALNAAVDGTSVPLSYSFPAGLTYPDDKGLPQEAAGTKAATINVIAGEPPFILFSGKYDPAIPSGDRIAGETYKTDPVVIPLASSGVVTLAEALAGVTGIDAEDGSTTVTVVEDIDALAIPKNIASVTPITYTTTDADGNTITRTRSLVVKDDSIVIDGDYIIIAKGFVVAKDSVMPSVIVPTSNADAWRTDGSKTGLTFTENAGSMTNAVGVYSDVAVLLKDGGAPALGADGTTQVKRTITVKVYQNPEAGASDIAKAWKHNGTNGVMYSITARHIRINLADAQALQGASGKEAALLTRTQATTYKRADWSNDAAATLVADSGFDAATLAAGQSYPLTFAVNKEAGTTVQVVMVIDNGEPPTLTVPKIKEIQVGATFPKGAFADSTPSFFQGVTVFDPEDAENGVSVTLEGNVTYSPTSINTQVAGLYAVTYTAKDSENNTTTAVGYVLVNDGTYLVDTTDGHESMVQAYDFVQSVKEDSPTWNKPGIIELSFAKTWDLTGDTAVETTPRVADDAGFQRTVAVYNPIKIDSTTKSTPVRSIVGAVIDKDELARGSNPDDPTDSAIYTVGANNASVLILDATNRNNLTAAGVKAWYIDKAAAAAYKTLGSTASHGVDVVSTTMPANPVANTTYQVTFCPAGIPAVTVTVDFVVGGTPPIIEWDAPSSSGAKDGGYPLVIPKESSTRILSKDEIKAKMTVIDGEDPRTPAQLKTATAITVDGSAAKDIDASVAAVYSVTYSITDNDGMTTTKTRAVIIDDGRHIIDEAEGVIISAKNYVMLQSSVQGTFAEVRDQSLVKAYTIDGTSIPSSQLEIKNFTATGYKREADPRVYNFTWMITGKATEKAITGTVVDADVIYPPGPEDLYTITAKHFTVNVETAGSMVASGNLNGAIETRSVVTVYPLTATADAGAYGYTINNGGFKAAQDEYVLQFGVKLSDDSVDATTTAVQVSAKGKVSQGDAPVLTAATPVNVWIGSGTAPAGSITAAAYAAGGGDKYGVTAIDTEDTSLGASDVTYVITNPKTGASLASVDTTTPGMYAIAYSVTDSDSNTATAERVVVVNDGRYSVNGNILEANSFVTRASDVKMNDLRGDILSKSAAGLYDGKTGEKLPVAEIYGVNYGTYSAAANTYTPITLTANNGKGGTVERDITGIVVDAAVIGPETPPAGTPTTTVWGTPLDLTISEAEDLAAGGGSAVLNALKAGATKTWPNTTVTIPNVKIVADTDSFIACLTDNNPSNNINTFKITVGDVNDETTIVLTIRVSAGNPPVVTATPKPLTFQVATTSGNLSQAQIMTGVTVADVEDEANIQTNLLPLTVVSILDVSDGDAGTAVSAIPANVAGIYQVTYTYTDADGNVDFDTRAIVVNDGRYINDDKNILEALSFAINSTNVVQTSAPQIIAYSEAKAWTVAGAAVGVVVEDSSPYRAEPHSRYGLNIMPSGNIDLKRTIYAKVVNDTATAVPNVNENSDNGEKYAITAKNFRMNATDAKALAAKSSSDIATALLASAQVNIYDRTDKDFLDAPSMAKELVSDGGFAAAGSTLKDLDQFTLTFHCAQDPDAIVAITLFISDGRPPEIYLPDVRIVWIADPASPKRPAGSVLPANWDYITTDKSNTNKADDVYATDDRENATISSKLKAGTLSGGTFTEGTPINMSKVAWQEVTYAVTDSDYNTTYKTDLVLVTDGTIVYSNGYSVEAWDFIETKDNVTANGNGDAQILTLSLAKASFLDRSNSAGAELVDVSSQLTVKNNGGYKAVEDDYKIQIGITGRDEPVRDIVGKVIDKDVLVEEIIDGVRYYIAANNAAIKTNEATSYIGKDDPAKSKLIAAAQAQSWKITGEANILGTTPNWFAEIETNNINATTIKPGEAIAVVFAPKDAMSVKAPTIFQLDNGNNPVITFSPSSAPDKKDGGEPLFIQQNTTATNPVYATDADLKEKMTVTDIEDMAKGTTADQLKTSTVVVRPAGGDIDLRNVGVYSISYEVTDSDGNKTTATRALIVDDGRYEVIKDASINDENSGIIIGARDFIVKRSTMAGTEQEAKSLSYVEAFDIKGNALSITMKTVAPSTYGPSAPDDVYDITWYAETTDGNKSIQKVIKAYVVEADVIHPGEKSSQYAIAASHFRVNQVDAQAIIAKGQQGFLDAANVQVFPLVSTVSTKAPLLVDSANFGGGTTPPTLNAYPNITFRIDGIPATAQKVAITGTISNGTPPALEVPTPVNVWVGSGTMPAGAVSLADYLAGGADKYLVTVSDAEDGTDLGLGDVSVSYVNPTTGVDTAKVGTYTLSYSVTDADHNTVTKSRVVAINDGRYELGNGRILMANSFITKLSDVNATNLSGDILGKSYAALTNGTTGANIDLAGEVTVPILGGYKKEAGVYSGIEVHARDFVGSTLQPNPIVRVITGEVIDADVLIDSSTDPTQDSYFVFGKHLELRVGEAQEIMTGFWKGVDYGSQDAALLAALNAGARKSQAAGGIEVLNVKVVNDGGFSDSTETYWVTIADENDNVNNASDKLQVLVANGNAPTISATPAPLVIAWDPLSSANLTRAQLMSGVVATDVEDSASAINAAIKINPDATGNEVLPAIPLNVGSLTQIVYSVTDTDGNTKTVQRAVVVQDGTFVATSAYVVRAKSFVIGVADVGVGPNYTQLLLDQTEAKAWLTTGEPKVAAVKYSSNFTNAQGDYKIGIGVEGFDQSVIVNEVTGKVLPEDASGGNGVNYSIVAKDFRINLKDAAKLQGLATSNPNDYIREFLNRSGAKSYQRTADLPVGGTPTLRNDGSFATYTFAQENDPAYPTQIKVQFMVSEENNTWCEITVTVSNGNYPSLVVPPLRSVALNGTFDLMQGVDYWDSEDDKSTLVLSVVVDGTPGKTIDTSVNEAIYEVTYTVVDTEGNTTTKSGYVLVGWEVSDGYALSAGSFVTTVAEVEAAASKHNLIKQLSHAKAKQVVLDQNGLVTGLVDADTVILNDKNFAAVVDLYANIEVGVDSSTGPKKSINGRVIAKDAISNTLDSNGVVNDKNTDNPADNNRYIVAANNVFLTWAQAGDLAGKTDSVTIAKLIQLAEAVGYKILPDNSDITHQVTVTTNAIKQESGDWDVTFIPVGVGGVSVTVTFNVDQGVMPVITADSPLEVAVIDSATPIYMTRAELMVGVAGSDADNPTFSLNNVVITDANGLPVENKIDKTIAGVYKVTYSVADNIMVDPGTGEPLTSSVSRAIIVNDGRYVFVKDSNPANPVDENSGVIVGARDFVIQSSVVNGNEIQAKSRSYAEAYDILGNAVNFTWTKASSEAYINKAPAGIYDITWEAKTPDGTRVVQTTIKAYVVDADYVDAGEKASKYAIVASNFAVNQVDAQAIIVAGQQGYLDAAKVQVFPLVSSASAKAALLADAANFGGGTTPPALSAYPNITFRIEGIPVTTQKAFITGTISNGTPPVLNVPTPLNVWIGEGAIPAGAIPVADYAGDKHGVSVTDTEDGTALTVADVTVAAISPTTGVDTTTAGLYTLRYSVTDSDHNTVSVTRVVVVNDGRYQPGVGRILLANSFIAKLADVNYLNIADDILSKSSAKLTNGIDGTNIDLTGEVSVPINGGYKKEVGVYTGIEVRARDFVGSIEQPNPIVRVITGEVVDASVLIQTNPDPTKDSYYVFGKHLDIRVGEAQEIKSGFWKGVDYGSQDAALIAALTAGARKSQANGTIENLTVKIVDDGGFSDTTKTYWVTIADKDGNVDNASDKLSVRVANGNPPKITATPIPLVIPWDSASSANLTRSQLMSVVSATDVEDSASSINAAIKINPDAAGKEVLPNIPLNVGSVTQITYSVTDSDGNTDTVQRAVVVQDGSMTITATHIVHAKPFVVDLDDVPPVGTNYESFILEQSEAKVWEVDGDELIAEVKADPGFTKEAGDYTLTIGIKGIDKSVASRGILGKVLPSGASGGNGVNYSIVAKDFRINLADAAKLQAKAGTDEYIKEMINRSGAVSYLRTQPNLPVGGKVTLKDDEGFATRVFALENDPNYPTQVKIQFMVFEENGTWCEITATVSNGNYPGLSVPALKSVPLNGTVDLLLGVDCWDSEDDKSKLVLNYVIDKTPGKTIDTSVKDAIYEVTYTVTDTEGNATSRSGYVMVGWEVVGDYAVNAGSFMTTVDEVNKAANKDELIKKLSHAQAKKVERNSSGAVTGLVDIAADVRDDGGFSAAVDRYPIQIGISAAAIPFKNIFGRVIAKDAISNTPDGSGVVNDANTSDPTDPNRYIVAANNVNLTWAEAGLLAGKMDGVTIAALIAKAEAVGYKILPAGTDTAHPVTVFANSIQQATGDWDVTFIPAEVGGVEVTVKFSVDQGVMPTIVGSMLEIPVSGAAGPEFASRQDLLQAITIADPDNPTLSLNDVVIVDVATGQLPVIDKTKPGIYQVTYTVPDNIMVDTATGKPKTSSVTRAIVVNDGRFVTDDAEQIIVGAKDFIVSTKIKNWNGTADEAIRLSCAEAYDYEGNKLAPVVIKGTLPAGWVAETEGVYSFTFGVNGYTKTKAIKGEVVNADAIDFGPEEDSYYNTPYVLLAWNFAKDVADVVVPVTPAALTTDSKAQVRVLVPNKTNPGVAVLDDGGFINSKFDYPIRFGISGFGNTYLANIIGKVTDGAFPTIVAPGPVEVLPGIAWDPMEGVYASDPGDGVVTSGVTYGPAPDSKPLDLDVPGIYVIRYEITDSDGNKTTKDRVVVVNDGRYKVGNDRIIEAYSFVIKSDDVAANANLRTGQLLGESKAKVYDAKTGNELPQNITVNGGGFAATPNDYNVRLTVADNPTALTKDIVAKVIDADVIGGTEDPNNPGSTVYTMGNNLVLRVAEAENLLAKGDAELLKALKAASIVASPNGTITDQGVAISSSNFADAPGVYKVCVVDLDGISEIELEIRVETGKEPALTPNKPAVVAVNPYGGYLSDAQIIGKATAKDAEDGDLTSSVKVVGNPQIPADIPGVYKVDLEVTDSDGNKATKSTTVVVDDGGFVIVDNSILYAKDFTIPAAEVKTGALSEQILELAGVKAWDIDGNPVANLNVKLGGFIDARGVYVPRIEIPGTNVGKTITATVTSPLIIHSVNFHPNGGYLTGPATIRVQEPSTTLSYLPSTPLRPGYTFLGWTIASNGGAQFTSSYPLAGDMTVFAQWQKDAEVPPIVMPPAPPSVVNVYPARPTVVNPPSTFITVETFEPVAEPVVEKKEPVAPPVTVAEPTKNYEPETPLAAPEEKTWSLFDLCLVILSFVLLLGCLVKFFYDRRKSGSYEEKPISQSEWSVLTPEERGALFMRRENERKEHQEKQRRQSKEKMFYVNGVALLVGLVVFVEALIILFATQDFSAKMVVVDDYSIALSLVVMVQLIAPMAAAMLKNRGKGTDERESMQYPEQIVSSTLA